MVLFFTSNVLAPATPSVVIYMGRDKVENEDLIKYAYPECDVWFHVDKLSSAHVYLRMPEGMSWEAIPQALLVDCGQLVKANSIQGNKTDVVVIYTPVTNLKKTGDMATGQVSFHSDKKVKRVAIPDRVNAIVNRLNKTKEIREVDHEGDRLARQKEENLKKRLEANERKKAEQQLAEARKKEKDARGYSDIFAGHAGKTAEEIEDEEWERRQKVGDFDPDDDFM